MQLRLTRPEFAMLPAGAAAASLAIRAAAARAEPEEPLINRGQSKQCRFIPGAAGYLRSCWKSGHANSGALGHKRTSRIS
jgi:hypothetical protein